MSDYFGGRGLDRAVGCAMAAIAVALLAIGAIVGYLIWGGA